MSSGEYQFRERIALWQRQRNMVALANLGKQVALRLLTSHGYVVISTQEDRRGSAKMPTILPAKELEDFLCVSPDRKLVRVNSQSAVAKRSTGLDRDGNLRRPRMMMSSSPLPDWPLMARDLEAGDVDSQVIKVDLTLMAAQVFNVDDSGQLRPYTGVIDVEAAVAEVLVASQGAPTAPSYLDL